MKTNGRLVKAMLNKDYMCMRNHCYRNYELSNKARGLLGFMLQVNEENWEFSIKGLAACSKDGPDAISAGLKELSQHGYFMMIVFRQLNKGHYSKPDYHVSDIPLPKDYLATSFPGYSFNLERGLFVGTENGFSRLGKSQMGESSQLNTYLIKDINNTNDEEEKLNLETDTTAALPPEERKLQTAFILAQKYFVEIYPAMVEVLITEAKILPEKEPDFDFYGQLYNWLSYNSGHPALMTDPGKYIRGQNSFSQWLRNYHRFKTKPRYGKKKSASTEQQHLITEADARAVLTELISNPR